MLPKNDWYYSKSGKQVGPVSADTIRQVFDAGELAAQDAVWKVGMRGSAALCTYPEFADLLPRADAVPETPHYAGPRPASSQSVMATPLSLHFLRQTRPWGRLLSILLLCVAGLTIQRWLVPASDFTGVRQLLADDRYRTGWRTDNRIDRFFTCLLTAMRTKC
jgi:hypothetical protein